MDIFILVLTCFVNILLVSLVLLRHKSRRTELLFALMSFFVTVWIVANYQANYPVGDSLAVSDVANRVAYASGFLFIMFATALSYVFPVRRKLHRGEVTILSLLAVVALALSVTDLVAGNVHFNDNHQLTFTIGALLLPFSFVFLTLVVIIVRNLLFLQGVHDKRIKNQARLVMFAITTSAIGALTLNVLIPLIAGNWHTTRYGPLVSIILVSVIAYAIVKHRLFDIRLTAIRGATYATTLLALAVTYYLMAFVASVTLLHDSPAESVGLSPIYLLFAIVLAFFFYPVKQFLDHVSNNIFFRDRYKTEVFVDELSDLLASPMEFRGLLRRTSEKIASTFKAEQALFFLYYSNAIAHHLSAGTKGHSRLLIQDAHMLDAYVTRTKSAVIVTDLIEDENPDLWRMLVGHEVALVLPLRHAGEIIGYLMVGDHTTGSYTKRDLAVLKEISNELIIAIQNALLLHEEREVNAALKQQLENAQKEIEALSGRTK